MNGMWREEEGWNRMRGVTRNPMRGVGEDSLHPTINPPAKAILLDRVGLKAPKPPELQADESERSSWL